MKNYFWIFQNGGFFSIADISVKNQLILCSDSKKTLFELKAFQKLMQASVNRYFIAHMIPEIYTKNNRLKSFCNFLCMVLFIYCVCCYWQKIVILSPDLDHINKFHRTMSQFEINLLPKNKMFERLDYKSIHWFWLNISYQIWKKSKISTKVKF